MKTFVSEMYIYTNVHFSRENKRVLQIHLHLKNKYTYIKDYFNNFYIL